MGLETEKLLASKGVKLSMADVQEGPLKETAAELEKSGATVLATAVNGTDRKQVEDWIKATEDKFGKVDGAANLADVIGKQNNVASLQDIDDADWTLSWASMQKGC
jgi:NADP-dependent 3-hydroxy acid dehydrogenase YdfG